MSRLDELKKKYGGTSNEDNNTNKSRLDKLKEQSKTSTYGNTEDFETFVKDYTNYVESAQRNSKETGYKDAFLKRNNYSKSASELRTRLTDFRVMYNLNRSDLTDREKEMVRYLDEMEKGINSVESFFVDTAKGYSHWKTEDEYNEWVKNYEETQEKLAIDTESEQKTIDELKGLYSQIEASQSKAEEIKYKLSNGLYSNDVERQALESRLEKINSDADKIISAYGVEGFSGGGLDGFGNYISEKERNLADVIRLQKGHELQTVNDPNSEFYDPEFENYLDGQTETDKEIQDLIKQLSDPKLTGSQKLQLQAQLKLKTEELGATKKYNRIVSLRGEEGDEIMSNDAFARGGGVSIPQEFGKGQDDVRFARSLTDEEVEIYSYYLNKYGEDKAEAFLDSIRDTVTYRNAQKSFEAMKGNTALELISGIASGLEQFTTGMAGAIGMMFEPDEFKGEYPARGGMPTTELQYMSGMVREDLADDGFMLPDWLGGGSLGQAAYDMTTTISNQLPSILASTVVGAVASPVAGQIVGNTLLGASAMGNAYNEMRRLGYDKDQARTYGLLVGGSEAGLQYLLGGISSLGGKLSGNAIKSVLSNVDNAFARVAIQIGGEMLSEGFEEGLQTVLEPWFKSIATGVDFEAPNVGEVLYSSLLGALTAGVFDVGGTAIGRGSIAEAVGTYAQGKTLMKEGLSVEKLSKLGSTFSADTVAHQLAGRVNEKTGAYTIGRLFNEINAELTTQNQNDIIRSLERKGVRPSDAKTIATALANVVAGVELSEQEIKALESNPVIAQTFNDVIINPNSTVNQRIKGYNEAMRTKSSVAPQESTQQAKVEGVDKNTSVEENAENEPYKVSADGKTIYNDEDVTIKRIVSTDGDIEVELDNGNIVKASDLSLSSKEEALMYEMVAKMGVSAYTANEIINTFKPTKFNQASMYFVNIPLAYNYGKIGYEAGLKNVNLSNVEKYKVYNLGRAEAEVKAANTKKQTATKSKTKKDGIIYENGYTYDEASASEIQKVSMAYIDVIQKLSNVQVHVFESVVKDGKRVAFIDGKWQPAPNGFFRNGNQIYIDINAGNNAEGAMLITMGHEITHYIRRWNEQGFKEFADFLFANYNKNVPVDDLLNKQKDKIIKRHKLNNEPIPSEAKLNDMAYEELVADAMSEMLTDPKAYDKLVALKQKNRTLWQKIGEAIKYVLDKFKAALGIYKSKDIAVTREAFHVRDFAPDVYEKLQDLYIKAFVEADANYEMAEKTLSENGVLVNSKTDSGSLMSVRDVLDGTQREKVAKALATRFGATQQEALSWIDAETSLASLILNPKYSQYLDYTADENEEAIKSNSDYPQGTVDFSNICKKRRDFTEIMNRILRSFPNHIFEPTDLAKIRTIMEQEGMEVACAICYVEDRRQLDSVVAQDFIDSLALYREGSNTRPDGKPFNANQLKAFKLIEGSDYTPSIYELISLEGRNELKAKNPAMEEAWVKFNNARGMQSVRLLLNDAEYKRQILNYNKNTVKSKNDNGGLRIYSFSDMEMFHLIDIIQVITDSATVGLSIQGYTKVNEYAKAVKDTGEKLNRSLIPKGDLGYHMENGKVVLDFDTVEGIDINHPDFFDSTNNPNVGNIVIGINKTQIRAAMVSKFIDYIIPFHTGQSKEVLGEKGIAKWVNYKDSQSERDLKTGKKSSHQINIYTEVIQASEKEGKPITNKVEFVNKFLEVCKENGLEPRFSEFLNVDENGDYVYTEGYHKFLVDFKTFDSNTGEYLPQMPVKPIFDSNYLTKLLRDYVKTQKVKDAEFAEKSPKVLERITNEIIKPKDTKFSDRDIQLPSNAEGIAKEYFGTTNKWSETGYLTKDGTQLDFSGRHWKKHPEFEVDMADSFFNGKRDVEHYEIVEAFPQFSDMSDMSHRGVILDSFLNRGNIRIVGNGIIELYTLPTEEQFEKLRSYFRENTGKSAYVGIGKNDGLSFEAGTNASTIIEDIRDYFSNNRGSQSDLMKFHTKYSDRDSLGNELSAEQQEFFKDSKVRDEDGNLLVVYHGTRKADFTEFKRNLNYFTDSTEMADSYAPNGEQFVGYLNIKKPFVVEANGDKWSRIAIDEETRKLLKKYGSSSFKEGGKWRTTPADIAWAIRDGVEEGDFDYDGVIIKNVDDTGSHWKIRDNVIANDYIVFNSNQFKSTTNKTPTSDPDIRYSERDSEQNSFNPEGKTLREQLEDAYSTSESFDQRYIYVGRFSKELRELLKDNDVILHDYPIAMNYRDAYLSMHSKETGKYHGNNINYHDLGVNGLEAALESFKSPLSIMKSKKEGKIELVIQGVDKKGNSLLSVVAINTVTQNGRKFLNAHIVTSVYGRRNIDSYIAKAEKEGRLIKAKKEETPQGIPQVQYKGNINEISSDNSISQSPNSVKSKFSDRDNPQAREFSDADTKFSIREEAPPKNTKEGYKVFVVKNGKLYPPMVANPNAEDTPVGVWLNADVGTRAADSKTGRMQVKAGGKGTQGGSGSLAFRPGWHLGETPLATQFDRLNPETGVKELFPENFVWALCDIAADHDYQEEAMSYGYTKNGKFQHSLAGLPKLPTDGYYKYRTNPNPDTVPWLITGAMKVKRLLSDAEVNAILESKGLPPKQRVGGDKTLADLGLSEYENKVYSDRDNYSEGLSETDKAVADEVIGRLKQDVMFGKYGTTKYASYTPSRINHEIAYSKADYVLDYANSYIAWIRPDDFLYATTVSERSVERIKQESRPLDIEQLREQRQPIYLAVDMNTGEIVGHEGRHRLTALKEAGIQKVAVIIEARHVNYPDNERTKPIEIMRLKGQSFGEYGKGYDFYLHDALPLSERYAGVVKELFSFDNNKGVMFSDRDSDGISNRTLLANALESVAQNDIEKNKLKQYKEKIALIESEQKKLGEIREKANELRIKKGRTPSETKTLRDLDAEATQIANRINTYDRQLLNLESTTALKNVLQREKEMAYKKAKKEGQEALAKQKEKDAKTIREVMTRYQESRKKAVEGRNKTELRHKIKKVVTDLNKLLLHGTKERNVKPGLQLAVASALEAINMDTVSADARIAKLKVELLKAKTPEKIEEIQHSIDYIRNMGDTMADKLEALRKAYTEIKNGADNEYSDQFKEEASLIESRIERVIKKVGNTPLRDMSLTQLEEVYEMYTMVLTTIRNANSLWKEGKILDLQQNASAVMQEIEERKKLKDEEAAIVDKVRSYTWNEMTPYYAFDRIGSDTFTSFFMEAIRGQDVYARDVDEAKRFADKTRSKYNYKKWNLDKVFEFKLKDGRIFKTTLKHMLSIYAYSKRDQALLHMSIGGFFHNDKSTFRKKGGVLEFIKREESGYKIDAEILEEIKNTMTKDQLNYVDEMQEYLTKMGEKGNEVTRVLWGIDIFKEKIYFPLKSKDDFIKRSTETAQSVSLKNDGMTKETVPGASNPIVLEAFDDVWANHIERMSQYHGFVIPIDNLNKLHQYGTWVGTESMAVSTMLAKRFGSGVNEYITQFIKDLNGNAINPGAKNPLMGFLSKFKKTAVGASMSTVVQQPTAILRAMAIINPKYFVGKPNMSRLSKQWDEVRKYAPIAIIKEIGGFDAGSGVQTSRWLNSDSLRGVEKVMDTIDNISMKGAEIADQVGWTTIWEAVKREVKATTNLEVGSEAFNKKVGERFTEVIVKTQVYDSTLSRSGFMRSKSDTMKMLTAFMGEPTLSINMMFNAIINAKRGGSKLQAARTIGFVYASIVAASAMASFVYALRDDDEDESYLEKYMQSLGGEVISDVVLAPITSLPAIKDIVSIFQGWDVERTDVAIFKDIKDAFDGLDSETKSPYRKVEDFAGAIASAFGIPLKNLLRTGREVYNGFSAIFDNIQGGNVGKAFIEGVTGEEQSKSQKLYEAIVTDDKTRLEMLKKGYKDDKAYATAIKSALRENDSRIKEAAQARLDGNIAEYTRIARSIVAEGYFTQDTVVGAINAELNALKKGESTEPTETTNKATSIYNMDDYYNALDEGATASNVKEAMIQADIANGKDRDEAEADFNSQFVRVVQEEYEAGNINGFKAVNLLMTYGDKTEESASSKIQYWDFKKEYPDYDLSESAITKYYSEVEPYGITVDVYYDYSEQRSKCKGTDNDGDGRTDSGSVKAEVMRVINSLPISSSQKDALYYLNGWSASTLWQAPWH